MPADVSVVSSGHDVADARLHREAAALLRQGLTVEVLGLGAVADAPAGTTARTTPRSGMVARGVRALTLPFAAEGRVLLVLDPDLVPAALLAGALRRRRVVVDVHEDYPALLADRAWVPARLRALLQRLAAWCVALAGRAALTVVADDHVPPLAARDRLVVRNLPDLALLPPRGEPEPVRRAVYVGDLRTSRGLRSMVEAVAAAPGWELDLVGPVSGVDEPWLTARLAGDDLRGRVRLHGRQPPEQAWRIAAGASVGLALLEPTPAFRAAVPSKLYEYLASGLAVLATPLPRVAPLVEGSGGGRLAADAAEAAGVLRAWSDAPADLRACRAAGAAWAERELAGPSPYDVLAERVAALVRR